MDLLLEMDACELSAKARPRRGCAGRRAVSDHAGAFLRLLRLGPNKQMENYGQA